MPPEGTPKKEARSVWQTGVYGESFTYNTCIPISLLRHVKAIQGPVVSIIAQMEMYSGSQKSRKTTKSHHTTNFT